MSIDAIGSAFRFSKTYRGQTEEVGLRVKGSTGRVDPFYSFGRLFWDFFEPGSISFDEFYCYRNSFVSFACGAKC